MNSVGLNSKITVNSVGLKIYSVLLEQIMCRGSFKTFLHHPKMWKKNQRATIFDDSSIINNNLRE